MAGGDICTATRLRLSTGASVLMKTRPHSPADFFRSEADGLRWLAEARGAAVPEVLAAENDCLVVAWVESARPTVEAAERFGRDLAATHRAGAPGFGTAAGVDGYIGALPLPNREAPSWPEFFATRRVLPYLKLARDRGGISAGDAAAVERVVRRLTDLAGPAEPPARLHGDLWSGNLRLGPGRPGLADRPGGARRPPGERPGDARAVRLPAAAAGARGLQEAARWPTAGRTGSPCTSCSRCSCTPACSAAPGTAPGPATRPAACSDPRRKNPAESARTHEKPRRLGANARKEPVESARTQV